MGLLLRRLLFKTKIALRGEADVVVVLVVGRIGFDKFSSTF